VERRQLIAVAVSNHRRLIKPRVVIAALLDPMPGRHGLHRRVSDGAPVARRYSAIAQRF
jgi:hypothetical protein